MSHLLEIEELSIAFPRGASSGAVVRNVSLALDPGDCLGLVGESGSGKSMTALGILGLVPPPGRVTGGRIRLAGEDILGLTEAGWRNVRGGKIAMIFQEPATALNPVLTIGSQIAEVLRLHRGMSRRTAREESVRLLDLVALPDAAERARDYPHHLSGGQCQRVVIAMALAGQPRVLLADEPTTALDVTVQAQILDLLERLRAELNLAILLITHDLGVVARNCTRVAVLYAGEVVEEASVAELFAAPRHPYTRALLATSLRLGQRQQKGHLPTIPGRVVDPFERPSGCAFHHRCQERIVGCDRAEPPEVDLAGGRRVRCFLAGAPSEP